MLRSVIAHPLALARNMLFGENVDCGNESLVWPDYSSFIGSDRFRPAFFIYFFSNHTIRHNFAVVIVPSVTVQNYAPEYAAFMSVQLLLSEFCVDGTETSINSCYRSTHTILMPFARYLCKTIIAAADQSICFWFSVVMAGQVYPSLI